MRHRGGARRRPGRAGITGPPGAGKSTLAAALIWGVNTLFLLDAGLDIFGVFIANAAFTAGNVVFELPTGVFADTRGRRASFLTSAVVLCAATLVYVGVAKAHGGLLAFGIACALVERSRSGRGQVVDAAMVEAWKSEVGQQG